MTTKMCAEGSFKGGRKDLRMKMRRIRYMFVGLILHLAVYHFEYRITNLIGWAYITPTAV